MFADDTKIFRKITSPSDSAMIQQDLEGFITLCNQVGYKIDISKCSVISFYRRQFVKYTYNISGDNLTHVNEVIRV